MNLGLLIFGSVLFITSTIYFAILIERIVKNDWKTAAYFNASNMVITVYLMIISIYLIISELKTII